MRKNIHIPYNKSKEILQNLEHSFSVYYANDESALELLAEKTKSKEDPFYKKVSEDSKTNIDRTGFSASWLFNLLYLEDDSKRNFSGRLYNCFGKLIAFYQGHKYGGKDEYGEPIYTSIHDQSLITDVSENSKPALTKQEKSITHDSIVSSDENLQEDSKNRNSKDVIQKEWFKRILKITKKRFFILPSIILILVLIFFYLVKPYREKQNIIQLAQIENQKRLGKIYDLEKDIADELRDDYLKDNKKNLSDGLINQIVRLSKSFKPYYYFRDNNKVFLSPERAQLFILLIELDLDISTYIKLFRNSNFEYSDFYKMNFIKFDITKIIEGVSIHQDENADFFITVSKRPNLKFSSFEKATIKKSKLYGDFKGSNFSNSRFIDSGFAFSDVSESNFKNSDTIVISGYYSDFSNSNFSESTLYCSFNFSDLRGALFDYSNINDYNAFFKPFETSLANPYYTFENVFFSSPYLLTNYGFKIEHIIKEIHKNKIKKVDSGFAVAKMEIFEKHKDKSLNYGNWLLGYDYKLKGKDSLYIKEYPQSFSIEIPNNSNLDLLKNIWKDDIAKIYSYITRTNDNYYFDFEVRKHIHLLISYGLKKREFLDKYSYFSDTIDIYAGKNFYFSKNRNDNTDRWKYNKPVPQDSNKKLPASFKNCTLNTVGFSTRIIETSFENSTFINTLFSEYSELHDIDFRGIKGELIFENEIKFQNLIFDGNYEKHVKLISLEKEDSLLNSNRFIKSFENEKKLLISDSTYMSKIQSLKKLGIDVN